LATISNVHAGRRFPISGLRLGKEALKIVGEVQQYNECESFEVAVLYLFVKRIDPLTACTEFLFVFGHKPIFFEMKMTEKIKSIQS